MKNGYVYIFFFIRFETRVTTLRNDKMTASFICVRRMYISMPVSKPTNLRHILTFLCNIELMITIFMVNKHVALYYIAEFLKKLS